MRMNISTRIGGAILGLVVMLLACCGAGYYAASSLSDGLDYVTTTAWDAADGASAAPENAAAPVSWEPDPNNRFTSATSGEGAAVFGNFQP